MEAVAAQLNTEEPVGERALQRALIIWALSKQAVDSQCPGLLFVS